MVKKLILLVWQKILINLTSEKNISRIAKEINVANATCYQNLALLEKEKLITSKRTGRNKIITITEKGKKIAEALRGARV